MATAVKPGTFGVVRTKDIGGALIRVGTRSQVNHAFVVVEGDMVVEAQPRGAVLTPLADYDGYLVVYNDLEYLSDEQRTAITAAARRLVGTPYSFLDIVVLALACFGIRWGWASRRIEKNSQLICSQLVDRAYLDAGLHLFNDGRLSGQVTPGDLLMYIASHAWT